MRTGVLRPWRRISGFGWSEGCNSCLCYRIAAARSPDSRPVCAGPSWSPWSSVHPVSEAWAGGSIDSEGKESGGSSSDITIAHRCGRGQGGISKGTRAHCACLAPSSSLLPLFGLSLPSFLPLTFLPSLPHSSVPVSNLDPYRLCCKAGGAPRPAELGGFCTNEHYL